MLAKKYLKNQYQTSVNLDKRISLYKKFNPKKFNFKKWIFKQFPKTSKAKILELGCATADLWTDNSDKLPNGWKITLSDVSTGMVRQAKKNLTNHKQFSFRVIDAKKIPFPDNSFDFVIANHMLYHVEHLDQSLAEIKRVLKPEGSLYATTNGLKNLKTIFDIAAKFGLYKHPLFKIDQFCLENGQAKLKKYFPLVTLIRAREHPLHITKAQPLIDYIESTNPKNSPKKYQKLKNYIEQKINQDGYIKVKKDTGLFIAKK